MLPLRACHTGVLLLVALLLGAVGGALAGDGLPERIASITYLTSSTVYIGAGRDDGIDQGDVLEVVRDGTIVARLEVTDLSSRRASCRIVSGEVELIVGDDVRFVP